MPGDFGDSTGGRYDGYGQVDPLAPSVANGQITPEQWAEYSRKRRNAQIFGYLATLGGMAGAGIAGSALGGGGAAASAEAGGSLAPIAGGSPWAVTPLATTATMSAPGAIGAGGAAAGAGLGAGAGAAKGIFAGMSARDLAALGLTGASTIGAAMSNPPNMNPSTQTTDPNLQKLMQTMQGRLDQSEPLYKSIMAMANGLLPTQYQNGGAGR